LAHGPVSAGSADDHSPVQHDILSRVTQAMARRPTRALLTHGTDQHTPGGAFETVLLHLFWWL